jgi:hypothetical protein
MVWIILTVTVCFSIGYAYASIRFQQLPGDILIQNVGSSYLVYSAEAQSDQ